MEKILKIILPLLLIFNISYSETIFSLKELKYYVSDSPDDFPLDSDFNTSGHDSIIPGKYIYYKLIGERVNDGEETYIQEVKMKIDIPIGVVIYYEAAADNPSEYKDIPYSITPKSGKVLNDIQGISFSHPPAGLTGTVKLHILGNNGNEDNQDKFYADFIDKIEIIIVTQVYSYSVE